MSFISNWLYGVDLDEEAAREKQLDAAGQVQADRYKAGGDEYQRIEESRGALAAVQESEKVQDNYTAEKTDVQASVDEAAFEGIKTSVPAQAVGAYVGAQGFVLKAIWKIVPWYIWLILFVGIGFYVYIQIKPLVRRS